MTEWIGSYTEDQKVGSTTEAVILKQKYEKWKQKKFGKQKKQILCWSITSLYGEFSGGVWYLCTCKNQLYRKIQTIYSDDSFIWTRLFPVDISG